MEQSFVEGEAIPIYVKDEDGKQILMRDNLYKIMSQDGVRDGNIMVLSVAGAMREGKSFILNFFKKYLESGMETNWLKVDKNTKLPGFSWRGGTKSNTMGILMWSKPYFAKLPRNEKVAVLLIDTQGAFDNENDIAQSSKIITMSLAISSHLMYNVNKCLRADKLQFFETFLEHAKMARSLQPDSSIFQSLTFLVRDWADADEYAYGSEDGETYVDDQMNGRTKDNTKRSKFKDLFNKVTSFLLPYPGKCVAESSSKEFGGSLQGIDEEFLEYVDKLVHFLFDPKKIVLKKCNDEPVSGLALVEIAVQFDKILQSDELPTPKDFLQAQTEAFLANIIEDFRRKLEGNIIKSLDGKPFVDESEFKEISSKAYSRVMDEFEKKPFYGGDEARKQCKSKLAEQLKQDVAQHAERNATKQIQCKIQYEEFLKSEAKKLQTLMEETLGPYAESSVITKACEDHKARVANIFKEKGFGVEELDKEYIEVMLKRIDDLSAEIIRNTSNNRKILQLTCIQKISQIEEDVRITIKKELTDVVFDNTDEMKRFLSRIKNDAMKAWENSLTEEIPESMGQELVEVLKAKLDKLDALVDEEQRENKRLLGMTADRELDKLRQYYVELMYQELGKDVKDERELDDMNEKNINKTKQHLQELNLALYVRDKCLQQLQTAITEEYRLVWRRNQENEKDFHDLCLQEIRSCLKQAKNEIEKNCGNDLKDDNVLKTIHAEAKERALEVFRGLENKGPKRLVKQHESNLSDRLDQLLKDVKMQNQKLGETILREVEEMASKSKIQYKERMYEELDSPTALQESDLREVHEMAKNSIVEDFLEKIRDKPERIKTQSKADLIKKMDSMLGTFRQENKNKMRNNEQEKDEIVRDCLSIYNQEMQQACESIIDEDRLEEKQKDAEHSAWDKLSQVKADSAILDSCKERLSSLISERFEYYKKVAANKKKWAGSKCEQVMAVLRKAFEREVELSTGGRCCSQRKMKEYFLKAQKKVENDLQKIKDSESVKQFCTENLENAMEGWIEDLNNTNKQEEVEFKSLCKKAVNRSVEKYKSLINRTALEIVEEGELIPFHDRATKSTLTSYDREELLGNEEIVLAQRKHLEETIDTEWEDFRLQRSDMLEKRRNDGDDGLPAAQALYNEEMKKKIRENIFSVDALEGFDRYASDEAISKIKAQKLPKSVHSECVEKLKEMLKRDLENWKRLNEELKVQRQRDLEKYVRKECLNAYKGKMEELCGEIYYQDNWMKTHHKNAKKHAVTKFNSYKNHLPEENVVDDCLTTLDSICNDEKENFEQNNRENKMVCEQESRKILKEATSKYLTAMEQETRGSALKEEDLKKCHTNAKIKTEKLLFNELTSKRADIKEHVEAKFEDAIYKAFDEIISDNEMKTNDVKSTLAKHMKIVIAFYKTQMESALQTECLHTESDFKKIHSGAVESTKNKDQSLTDIVRQSSDFQDFQRSRDSEIGKLRNEFANKNKNLMDERTKRYLAWENEHYNSYSSGAREAKRKADNKSRRKSSKQKDFESFEESARKKVMNDAAAKPGPDKCPQCSKCSGEAMRRLKATIDSLYSSIYNSIDGWF